MADRTLRTGVEVDTDAAQRNLRKLGEQAKDTGKDLDRASGDTEKLEKASRDAAVDVDKLADELRNSATTTKNFADDTDRAGDRIKDTYDTVESGAMGTASSIGEAFGEGGGIQSGLGSATEAIESFAEMFGPAGLLVSFIGGAAIGALSKFLNKAEEVSEAVKQRASEMTDALIEAKGELDDAYAEEQVLEFIKVNGKAFDAIMEVEGGADLLTEAYKGNRFAAQQLVDALDDKIRSDEDEIEALYDKVAAQGYATETDQRNLNALRDRIQANKDAKKAIQEQTDVIDESSNEYRRYNDYLDRNTDKQDANAAAVNRNAEAHARLAQKSYDAQAAIRQGGVGGRSSGGSTSGRAAGGPVEAGQPYTVGEYGKELFVPEVDGTIVSAPDLRRAGSAVTLNMTVVTNDPMRMASQTNAALRRYRFRNGA